MSLASVLLARGRFRVRKEDDEVPELVHEAVMSLYLKCWSKRLTATEVIYRTDLTEKIPFACYSIITVISRPALEGRFMTERSAVCNWSLTGFNQTWTLLAYRIIAAIMNKLKLDVFSFLRNRLFCLCESGLWWCRRVSPCDLQHRGSFWLWPPVYILHPSLALLLGSLLTRSSGSQAPLTGSLTLISCWLLMSVAVWIFNT